MWFSAILIAWVFASKLIRYQWSNAAILHSAAQHYTHKFSWYTNTEGNFCFVTKRDWSADRNQNALCTITFRRLASTAGDFISGEESSPSRKMSRWNTVSGTQYNDSRAVQSNCFVIFSATPKTQTIIQDIFQSVDPVSTTKLNKYEALRNWFRFNRGQWQLQGWQRQGRHYLGHVTLCPSTPTVNKINVVYGFRLLQKVLRGRHPKSCTVAVSANLFGLFTRFSERICLFQDTRGRASNSRNIRTSGKPAGSTNTCSTQMVWPGLGVVNICRQGTVW